MQGADILRSVLAANNVTVLTSSKADKLSREDEKYFPVSPPSVHQMVLTLERSGFIGRQPRTPRSIELLVDPKQLPELL